LGAPAEAAQSERSQRVERGGVMRVRRTAFRDFASSGVAFATADAVATCADCLRLEGRQ
jgi:hypothetical protein